MNWIKWLEASWETKKFPLDTTVVSNRIFFLVMRRYIFTELERKRLQKWLAGDLSADDSTVLNTTLDRVRIYKKGLLADLHLYIQALRRLNLERGFER
jgi:hypothetical protein